MTKFNNPKLQKIYEESKGVFENHKQELDKIYEDIRNLEKYLSSNASIVCTLDFAPKNIKLAWNGKRILCIAENTTKPLMECELYLRIRAYPLLSELFHYAVFGQPHFDSSLKNEGLSLALFGEL